MEKVLRCMTCGAEYLAQSRPDLGDKIFLPLGWTGTLDDCKCRKCSPEIDWETITHGRDSDK